ncbi:MAG: hypothetical protein L6408_00145 [Nanoarchaeota archaeon]|nr:hypothetical protein [Nanoarchaeota archaeon]
MKKLIYIILILVIVCICFWLILTKIFSKPSEEQKQSDILLKQQDLKLKQESVEAELDNNMDESRAGSFKVSSGPDSYPKFASGWVDPKQPKIGEEQYISIKMRDPGGIKSVVLEIQDEEGKTTIETFNLELVEGNEQEGVWAGAWQVRDVEKQFRAVFIAENINGEIDDLTYFIMLGSI